MLRAGRLHVQALLALSLLLAHASADAGMAERQATGRTTIPLRDERPTLLALAYQPTSILAPPSGLLRPAHVRSALAVGTERWNRAARTDESDESGGMRSNVRWVSIILGLAAAGLGYEYDRDARTAWDERDEAFRSYLDAYTSNDVRQWRQAHAEAESRGDSALLRRNVAYGASVAFVSFGIALSIWP